MRDSPGVGGVEPLELVVEVLGLVKRPRALDVLDVVVGRPIGEREEEFVLRLVRGDDRRQGVEKFADDEPIRREFEGKSVNLEILAEDLNGLDLGHRRQRGRRGRVGVGVGGRGGGGEFRRSKSLSRRRGRPELENTVDPTQRNVVITK